MDYEMDHLGTILRTGCETEHARRQERRALLWRDAARCALGIATLGFGLTVLAKGSDVLQGLKSAPVTCPPAKVRTMDAPGALSPLHRADLRLIEHLKARLITQRQLGARLTLQMGQLERNRQELARRLMRHERRL